ncbi:MAG: hypothetical protein HY305_06485, partial [Sphingobacteriales bacterium]|nr:hypothetical protein [Sphingobacteriales bacterium]
GRFKKFDPYIGGGIGYYHFETKSTNSIAIKTFYFPDAIAVSSQLGCKYYFSPRIGAYAEVGYVGGSVIQVGITAKIVR